MAMFFKVMFVILTCLIFRFVVMPTATPIHGIAMYVQYAFAIFVSACLAGIITSVSRIVDTIL